MNTIFNCVKSLQDDIEELWDTIKNNNKIRKLKIENVKLNQALSLTIFNIGFCLIFQFSAHWPSSNWQ